MEDSGFHSTELPLNMDGIYDDDQETISDLTTLPASSQFSTFHVDPNITSSGFPSSGRESPNTFDHTTPEDASGPGPSSSLWQMRNTVRRSWIWQYGKFILHIDIPSFRLI